MSDIKLTQDADALICLIYKYYLELHDNGISKSEAKILGSSKDINNNIIPEWTFDDVDDTCRELGRANLLTIVYASDICYDVLLNDEAIVYMEKRFSNKVKNLLDYINVIKFW